MVRLRRGLRPRPEKHKPEVVTGSFQLRYEDVIEQNRTALVVVFAVGLLVVAAFLPKAADRSIAGGDQVSVEAETGVVVHPELIQERGGDVTASGNSFIEFNTPADTAD